MSHQLIVDIGQHSDKGRKKTNQDFHAALVPAEPLVNTKGVAVAMADGISSSDVSQIASKTAVTGFLEDYYCTSELWSVKTSVLRVLRATNSWLCAQARNSPLRYNKDKGYVCTFSALVIKSTTVHIFHAGDTRIYRMLDNNLEQLTKDHRLWESQEKSYLSRALGINENLELDYQSHVLDKGDIFILATDGIYEHTTESFIVDMVNANKSDLNLAAKLILDDAYTNGSTDNLSIQIVRIDQLPHYNSDEIYQQLTMLPFLPDLGPRMTIDGYEIVRELHHSSRSHVYLARDTETAEHVVIKTPSVDLRNNVEYLERFLMEEWIARKINSANILKTCAQMRKRNYLYVVTEYIEGQTLAQWIIDHPKPDVETVRGIIDQIANGLRAFHRQEMLHQDIRPNNIMIDKTGTVKIIDFGSTRVAGLLDINRPIEQNNIQGTAQYTAPEYYLGEIGSRQSDLFSLGVITYQMLTGKLPYGTQVSKIQNKSALRRLHYKPADPELHIPSWIDEAIRKAVHPISNKRYPVMSEFIYDMRHPNKAFLSKTRPPLMERNPVLFWKSVSLILSIIIVLLLNSMATTS